MEIRFIESKETWPLRHRILRPHQRLEEMGYPGDDSKKNFHLGAFSETGQLETIASVYLESHPEIQQTNHVYRLRGMATSASVRGQGWGKAVLLAAIEETKKRGGKIIWCNARELASHFYFKLGFKKQKPDLYEIEGIGPHYLLYLDL